MTERTQPDGKGLILGGSLVVLGASVAFAGFKYFSRSPRPRGSKPDAGGEGLEGTESKHDGADTSASVLVSSPHGPNPYTLSPEGTPLASSSSPLSSTTPLASSSSKLFFASSSSYLSSSCSPSSSTTANNTVLLSPPLPKSLSPSKSPRSPHTSSSSSSSASSSSSSSSSSSCASASFAPLTSTSFSSTSCSCSCMHDSSSVFATSSSSSSSLYSSSSSLSPRPSPSALPAKPPPRLRVGETSLDSDPSSNYGASDADKKREALRLSKLAAERHGSGDYREALNLFTRAISLHPHFKYYTNRALTAIQESLYEEALADARASIMIKPTPKGHHAMGSALMGLRRYEEAVKELENVFLFPTVEARDIKLSSKLIVECQAKIAKRRRKQEKAKAVKDPPPPYASTDNLDSQSIEWSGVLVPKTEEPVVTIRTDEAKLS